ncbi:type II toxin-antitoxin system HicA family toxin [Salinicola sp. CPA57]|uniref:type II toxin-antitoxin system HicA family toxin n=1 Tax=Salinicola sp. CPA57 TaxID=1949080 RepID=UPI000DA1E1B8|nr:type II toxin-antitoxin system HicA family toxin [Salinicola sp. CPA57]
MKGDRIERLRGRPKDYTYDELKALLVWLGYREKTGSGSRRKFIDETNNKILLHKPHPKNILKDYVMKEVLETLEAHGKI